MSSYTKRNTKGETMMDNEQVENSDEIMNKFNESIGLGHEPIRELKKVSDEDVDTWSYIAPYERMLLTQIQFIGKKFNIKIIEGIILKPYYRIGLSINGNARIQFEKAHTGLLEVLKPLLAGTVNKENIGSLETKNRRL